MNVLILTSCGCEGNGTDGVRNDDWGGHGGDQEAGDQGHVKQALGSE